METDYCVITRKNQNLYRNLVRQMAGRNKGNLLSQIDIQRKKIARGEVLFLKSDRNIKRNPGHLCRVAHSPSEIVRCWGRMIRTRDEKERSQNHRIRISLSSCRMK